MAFARVTAESMKVCEVLVGCVCDLSGVSVCVCVCVCVRVRELIMGVTVGVGASEYDVYAVYIDPS